MTVNWCCVYKLVIQKTCLVVIVVGIKVRTNWGISSALKYVLLINFAPIIYCIHGTIDMPYWVPNFLFVWRQYDTVNVNYGASQLNERCCCHIEAKLNCFRVSLFFIHVENTKKIEAPQVSLRRYYNIFNAFRFVHRCFH